MKLLHPALTRLCVALFCLTSLSQISHAQNACSGISGKVFLDYNFDGVDNENGAGVPGITVSICSVSGNTVTVVTAADGTFAAPQLGSGAYRVEFSIPTNLKYLKPTASGTNNASLEQFVTAPKCNVSLGVSYPPDYCQANPPLVVPCYVNGDPTNASGSAKDSFALVSVPFQTTDGASSSNLNKLIKAKDIGSVWGVAYDKTKKTIITTSVLHRHVGFGNAGAGGIYFIDYSNPANPVVSGSLSLNAGSIARTDLSGNPTQPSYDENAFSNAGKMSLGGAVVTDDNQKLYVVNLFDRKLYGINLNNYNTFGTIPTTADITETVAMPTPCGNAGVFRPWAVTCHQGKIYVGGVCSAETSQSANDLTAYVYVLSGNAFSQVTSFKLNYPRGYAANFAASINAWLPWQDDYTKIPLVRDEFFINPQPILSDIEFDVDGAMVLGFTDRMGLQAGFKNYVPDPTHTKNFILATTISAGDIVRVCNNAGTYVLENGATCVTTGGKNNNQGPGNSEYYWSDYYTYNTNDASEPGFKFHQEITTGGLELIPGTGVTVSTLYAPLADAQSAGVSWFDNTKGNRQKSFAIYTHSTTNVGFFGKGNGLGDIKAACNAAPIQIGNRVWADCNANGTQDAGEVGLSGVIVSLYDNNCNFITSTITNSDGIYNFNNLNPNTNYCIVFGASQFSSNKLNVGGVLYTLSPSKVGSGGNKTENDSDPTIGPTNSDAPLCASGLPYIKVTTLTPGCTDNSFDAGFIPPQLVLTSIILTPENCSGANDGTIKINATLASSTVEYSIDGGNSFQTSNTFTALAPKDYHIIARAVNGGIVCGTIDQTVTINAGKKLDPPTVTADSVCQFNVYSINGGLTAACAACPAQLLPTILLYDATGKQVGTGSPFDPLKAKLISSATSGTYTFYAVCQCGTGCFSEKQAVSFKVIALPAPQITGNELPCNNETARYTTTLNPGSTYFWSLSGGGVLTASGNFATVKWLSASNTGPYILTVKERNASGCDKSTDFIVNIKAISLTCSAKVNVSVDNTCKVELNVNNLLLGAPNGASQMKVELFWALNTPVLEDGVGKLTIDGLSNNVGTYDYLSKSFIYKVTENCSGNSCWGNILVEDKTPPAVTSPADITVSCSQVTDGAGPSTTISGNVFVSDCSFYSSSYSDVFYDAPCTTPYTTFPSTISLLQRTKPDALPNADIVRIIVRTFKATDKFGNAASAQQIIYVRKAVLKNIICPPDFEMECSNYTSLSPSITGFPVLDVDGDLTTTFDRVTLDKSACRINTTYSDDTISICANSFKVIRNWKILDWCALDDPATPYDDRFKYCTQLIKVLDKTPPVTVAQFTQYYTYNNDLLGRDTLVNFDGISYLNGGNSDGIVQDVYAQGLTSSCGGKARFVIRATDKFCTKGKVSFNVSDSRIKLLRGYPTYDVTTGENLAIYEGTFDAFGDYTVVFYTADACGYATAKKTFVVHVRDNIKPQPVCILNTKVALTTDGVSRVAASAFNSGSTDNCAVQNVLVRRMFNCQNPSDIDFKEFVEFYCCDVDKTIQVVMRVFDYYGNYNDCMVNVAVEDKIKPTCVPPLDVRIACNKLDINNLANYGSPNFWDNCGIRDTAYTVSVQIDNCKLGTVTRRWTVTDNGGKADSCQQTITTFLVSDFTVDFPDDVVTDCFENIKSIEQQRAEMLTNPVSVDGNIVNNGCSVMAVKITDDTLTAVPGVCYKIIRKICVIDWCKYNPNNDAVDLNADNYGAPVCGDAHSNPLWQTQNIATWQNLDRPSCTSPSERRFRDADDLAGSGPQNYLSYGNQTLTNPTHPWAYSDGIICFKQVIKIIDNTPPVVTYCPKDTIIADVSTDCKAFATLRAEAQDVCNGKKYNSAGFLKYNWALVNVTTNTTVLSGVTNVAGVPLNYNTPYELRWLISDPCNNIVRCTTAVKAIDAKAPSLTCKDIKSELVALTSGSAGVDVWAREILSSLSDNCTDAATLTQSAAIERTSNSTGNYPTSPQIKIPMSCADAGKTIAARVWVRDTAGNANFCTVNIIVQDNLSACGVQQSPAVLSGAIKNENGDAVESVVVKANIGGTALSPITTTQTGNFAFSNLTAAQNISATAWRDDNPTNGVTTYDIALLSRHILDIQPLNSPYKIIAGDVNRDGDVSALDMLIMRRLVLRVIQSFPNNTSWRFVDKKYVFTNPTFPLAEDFPEVINTNILNGLNVANFVGIKVGDVNNSALANSAFNGIVTRGAKTLLTLTTPDKVLQTGEATEIILHTDKLTAQGFQFTLNTSDDLEVVGVAKTDNFDITDSNFGQFKNAVTVSWNGEATNTATDVIKIIVRAKNSTKISDALSISSNLTTVEAFNANGETGNVVLKVLQSESAAQTFKVYQNIPNPFTDKTIIGFDLPQSIPFTFTLSNVQGQVIKRIEQVGVSGYNNVTINKSDIQNGGVYYYRIEAGNDATTLLMVNY